MAAKSLKESKSYTVGLILPNISNDFFSTIALYIEEYMEQHHYSVFICNTANQEQKEKEYFRTLSGRGVDGIICISGLNALSDDIITGNMPVVCIDRHPENTKNIPWVMNDDRHGSYLATEHLIKRGCQHILYIGSYTAGYKKFEREEGYIDALKAYGRRVDRNYILYENGSKPHFRESADLVREFMKEDYPVDGIFASNDAAAYGALRTVQSLGIRVPEDLKIVGFDDSVYSRLASPAISTIARHPEELSRTGCKVLLEMMEDKEPEKREWTISTELIERESSQA
jgi:LacI family transcriptional regulator